MEMLGGLDCIAMAVEHLERTQSANGAPSTLMPIIDNNNSSSKTISTPAPAPPPPPLPLANIITTVPSYNLLPKQTAFAEQPRVVSDTEDIEKETEDAKCIEELRKMIFQIDLGEWKNMPSPPEGEVITTVTNHDVLCGRGGETNHHKGNITFRACVKACQPAYIEAKRRDKPYIAQRIVLFIRKMGGRFLKRERDTSVDAWKDVGNNKAREKTSQALREGAPELRGDVKEVTGPPTKASLASGPFVEYDSTIPKLVAVPSAFYPGGSPNIHLHPSSSSDSSSNRPNKKQRRISLFDVADASVAFHRPPSFLPMVSEDSILPRSQCGVGAEGEVGPSRCGSAPGSPRFTVSADEEERSNASPTAGHTSSSMMMTHGPRLKLLKKRFSIDVNSM